MLTPLNAYLHNILKHAISTPSLFMSNPFILNPKSKSSSKIQESIKICDLYTYELNLA